MVGLAAFVIQHPAIIIGAKLFENVLLTTSDQYFRQIPLDSLYLYAARGMLRELNDPFTKLETPEELKEPEYGGAGATYGGTGTSFTKAPGGVVIVEVFSGGPAALAGIRVGDKIVQVDSFDVRTWARARVREKLVGPEGSTVRLTVQREGVPEPLGFAVKRGAVHSKTVQYTRMLEHQIGYIPLTWFSESASSEVRAAADALIRAGAKRLILDLRFNPGGFSTEAVAASNLFLPQGKTVYITRSRSGEQIEATPGAPAYPDVPLVVLVNGASGSASEAVTGALQDHDRALVVGTTTFGKAVGVVSYPVGEGYAVQVSVFEWRTPLGRSLYKPHQSSYAPRVDSANFVESDSSVRARPRFTTGAGRVVYGGGGIVPDVIVSAVETSGDMKLVLAVADTVGGLFGATVAQYAAVLRGKIPRRLVVTPAMRADVVRRLRANGIALDAVTVAGGRRMLDDMIANQIASSLADDSVVPRDFGAADPQLQRAVAVLREAQDQASVFAAARRMADVVPATRPQPVKPARAARR